MNKAIWTALCGITIAQLAKLPMTYLTKQKIDLNTIVSTGGMPSSHSCGVVSLASYIGMEEGFDSTEFAIATMLGLIVMYDATGIRRYAGETAIQVNDLDIDVEKLAGEHPGVYHIRRAEKLKERLGHQPIEVLAGALLGIGVGTVSYVLKEMRTPWYNKRISKKLVTMGGHDVSKRVSRLPDLFSRSKGLF